MTTRLAKVFVVFALTACNHQGLPSDGNVSGDGGPSDGGAHGSDGSPTCETSCYDCIGAGDRFVCLAPSVGDHFRAVCTQACVVSGDCPIDRPICARLEGHSIRVCVAEGLPAACPNAPRNRWCELAAPDCADAVTLARPFELLTGPYCGTEYIHCPSGCIGRDFDGGVVSARCR